jgi:hypothetical protein
VSERRWAMSRITAGDYLLRGNDDVSWWRVKRGMEVETDDDGGRWHRVQVWEVWRWHEPFAPDPTAYDMPDMIFDREHWSCVASWLLTRAEAIREVVRLSTP